MSTLPKSFIYCGTEKLSSEPVSLRAGPLTLMFEPDTAFLRHIRLGDFEVARAIYAAVRDQNWATVPPQVADLKSQVEKDHFELSFNVRCRQNDIGYFWRGQITGGADGRIRYIFDGEAKSSFLRNRIGICVLHPITECAGKPLQIEHADGTTEQGTFPQEIAPFQPFKQIQGLSYEIHAGIRAEFQFAGELFEMEDQRNWSDASFKTYCTPLDIPIPVQVRAGDKVHHEVSLSLSGAVRPILPVVQGRPAQISIATTPAFPLPPIGFCLARDAEPLTGKEVARLKALRPAHLRTELKLSDPRYAAILERAVVESKQVGAPLHVAIILNDAAVQQLNELRARIDTLRPNISLWLVFHEKEEATHDKWLSAARDALQSYAPNVLFCGGTLDWFTEVNRNRPAPGSPWFTCYSLTPQVHAFDNLTLVENLEAQAFTVESAKRICPKPVVISPVTLRMRDKSGSQIPSDNDARQVSLFASGWTLGSIARLAMTGHLHSLTYYETTGPRGLISSSAFQPLSSFPDAVFPLYHIFADIAEFPTQGIYSTRSTHPLQAEAITLFDGRERKRILVANLTGHPQEIKVKSGAVPARVRYLDETNAEEAMKDPENFRKQPDQTLQPVAAKIELQLKPYAIARLDVE
ncbi:MAG: hypothetical protein L0Y58_13260 [Verrucomicrobia subdivision 3 bacterium]|nr:hypothetical protein [Limisphaerales bacterium]